jgi:hypothetical protein
MSDEIFLEEILLGFLRSSKKVVLSNLDKKEGTDAYDVTVSFTVAKDFASTLANSLNNQFSDFFNKNNEQRAT